uniref:HTH La-type RNA-binding domain-containing protein n=1 Tax=Clastoptera arizonana TaxID=38151 RepID=A0A1B6DNY4_9HEMI
MNGDVGKLPSGAGYPTSPDALVGSPSPSTEYSSLNGVVDPLEFQDEPTPPGGSAPEAVSVVETAPSSASAAISGLPLDQLKQMLSSQLEYYFSRENLANDAYLLSQMDNDQYVPIWTVANFNQVKKLTKDINLITEVLRESPNVQVDEEGQKVRPNHKRCIVILREIPDSTPLEEVKALFSGKGCPRLISCEFAHNNSWYVTFENDEDAQRAYRFLREEVREFQGKPIMARIKAKPMNRLPIPPVGPAIGSMKNGYRTPPATATPSVFDPTTAYQTTQPRFVYANGSTLPHSVNYGNQVQIYTFQQQPFYPPSMMPPWGPASPAYFDIGSVFTVNGLAPQSFAKAQGSRYIPGSRSNRNKRSQVGDHRSTTVDGSVSRSHASTTAGKSGVKTVETHHNHTMTGINSKSHYHRDTAVVDTNDSVINRPLETDEAYRQPLNVSKDAMPPRRRKPQDDSRISSSPGPLPTAPNSARGPQFDLEADAFPPLPGLEAAAPAPPPPIPVAKVAPIEAVVPAAEPSSQSHWENRLSDVVKGTAKGKPIVSSSSTSCVSTKDKEAGSPRPRSATPPLSVPSQLPLPTPPPTPDKTVPVIAVAAKCCTADKSTKTDDMVLNGVTTEVVVSTSEVTSKSPLPLPMTTNAATMTDVASSPSSPQTQITEASGVGGIVKLSYAQVAQHPKDKQSVDRDKLITSLEEEKKEVLPATTAQAASRENPTGGRSGGMGRGTPRNVVQDRERVNRRRDRDLQRFNSRPRSPK